jgi:hypothetical protein
MADDHAYDQLAYCRQYMLPIWERWTDGNLAARHLIEHQGGDPRLRARLFRALRGTVRALEAGDNPCSIKAARAAAQACCEACIGAPAEQFERTCAQASVADIRAMWIQASEGGTHKVSNTDKVSLGAYDEPGPLDKAQIPLIKSPPA